MQSKINGASASCGRTSADESVSAAKSVQFVDFDCLVEKQHYANGQVALELVGADSKANRARGLLPGEPVARATVCLTGEHFAVDETAIKNCAENQGVLDVLVSAGIVAPTGRTVSSGWNDYPVVKVLI